MKDLNGIGVSSVVEAKLKADIDDYAIRTYYEPFRWHLGASLIGHKCARYLWYTFRWCVNEAPNGQKLRLFNRGHREEERFTEFLKGIGATLHTHDTSKPAKADGSYPQYRMYGVGDHFGGSLDGILYLPPRYEITTPILAEFKTSGTKHFSVVEEKGLQLGKPQHWAQTCTYGNAYKLEHVAYFIVNKDTDELTIKVAKLNWQHGQDMMHKAERIILSPEPPAKLNLNPTAFDCAYCAAKHVCHAGAKVAMNCRSCVNASPVPGGEFFCSTHNAVIPRDVVPRGCQLYKAIVNG